MGYSDSFDSGSSGLDSHELESNGLNRLLGLWQWAVDRGRPILGWPILFCVLGLAWIPAQTARANEWLVLEEFGSTIEPLGPLAVLLMWTVLGWRRNRWRDSAGHSVSQLRRMGQRVAWSLLFLFLGLVALSQALVGWIPGPILLIRTAIQGSWASLFAERMSDLIMVTSRLGRWWNGVMAGGATQDDLVFAIFAGAIVWFNGLLIGLISRRTEKGFLTALPSLWILLIALLYGAAGRIYLIGALILALLLHVLLDQKHMVRRWDETGVSYGDGLLVDRLVIASGASALVFVLAALIPNLSIEPLAERYYQLYQPFNAQVEGFGQRLFPDLKATSRFRGSSLSDGLPNSFLLGAGPDLSQHEVMRFRTDELYTFEPSLLEEIPVSGHYMRGGTLSTYNGLGWKNPIDVEREEVEADEYISHLLIQNPLAVSENKAILPRGRRLLTQDVFLSFTSRALYGAAEPLSFSVDFRLDQRGRGDQTAFWGRDANMLTSSYTVISAIPSVNSEALEAEQFIEDNDDWPELTKHLELPETVTERTRNLSRELVANAENPYAAATAIESYLRNFEYDLSVSEPPNDIVDVADYFIFDLQRGYCDYYATAFIVLARLAGLPTRFATGFAVGSWNAAEGMWIVTEAEAHSWPEVYFPTYGWIPFEPTAGRPVLQRIGVGLERDAVMNVPAVAAEVPEVAEAVESSWSWQMLIWPLLFLGLIGFLYRGILEWRNQKEDPWTMILRWGGKIGRPMTQGETVLEYGHGLSQHVTNRYRHQNQDHGRKVARELEAITDDLSSLRYRSPEYRKSIGDKLQARWISMRGYLRALR